jgi:hypothetical protein
VTDKPDQIEHQLKRRGNIDTQERARLRGAGSPLDFAQRNRGRLYELPHVTILRGEHLAGALEREKKREVSRNQTGAQEIQGCASVRPGASELKPEA